MKRPERKAINVHSLVLMGVPRRFAYKYNSLNYFQTYGNPDLEEVKEFVEDYMKNFDENFMIGNGICFYGSNGVGKSMLSCIILREAYRKRYSCRRQTFSNLISEYTAMWNSSNESAYEEYRGVELLVLEEVGKEVDSKIASPILEDCLRYREEHGLLTIICSNLSPKDLEERYGASIMSLIKGSMTPVKIVAEDKRQEVLKNDKSKKEFS